MFCAFFTIGTLNVIVHGDFLPRTLFNKFYIFFAIIRAMYLALVVAIKYSAFDVIFCDQNAAYIPVLRLFSRAKIFFYCHHPDYVQTPHNSLLKRLYFICISIPLDTAFHLTCLRSTVFPWRIVWLQTLCTRSRSTKTPSVSSPCFLDPYLM